MRSVEYVQSGTSALQDAKMLQKKTRKWMCCAIILLLLTAAVIVVVVRGADHALQGGGNGSGNSTHLHITGSWVMAHGAAASIHCWLSASSRNHNRWSPQFSAASQTTMAARSLKTYEKSNL